MPPTYPGNFTSDFALFLRYLWKGYWILITGLGCIALWEALCRHEARIRALFSTLHVFAARALGWVLTHTPSWKLVRIEKAKARKAVA